MAAIPTRVDEKGRFKIPAEYKREIDEKYGAQFYITSKDGKIARLYPMEVWERWSGKLAKRPDLDPALERFLDADELLRTRGRDGRAGQVLFPALLREAPSLKAEVAVVGIRAHSKSARQGSYSKRDERPFTPEDKALLATLGIW